MSNVSGIQQNRNMMVSDEEWLKIYQSRMTLNESAFQTFNFVNLLHPLTETLSSLMGCPFLKIKRPNSVSLEMEK